MSFRQNVNDITLVFYCIVVGPPRRIRISVIDFIYFAILPSELGVFVGMVFYVFVFVQKNRRLSLIDSRGLIGVKVVGARLDFFRLLVREVRLLLRYMLDLRDVFGFSAGAIQNTRQNITHKQPASKPEPHVISWINIEFG